VLQGLEKGFDYKKVLKAFKKGELLSTSPASAAGPCQPLSVHEGLTCTHVMHVADTQYVLAAEFCCNGTVVEDPELGKVIQLQGDQRKNVSTFLVSNNIAKKDLIKIHGF
jgi:translation initiation factor 1